MFLVKPRGQSCRELWSEDWWAQSQHEVHGAWGKQGCCTLKDSWAQPCSHICCWGFPIGCCFPFQRWTVVAKVGTVAHKGVGSPQGSLLIQVSPVFYIFPCTWKLLLPWLRGPYMLPLGGASATWANWGLHPESSQYKETDLGVQALLQPLQKLYWLWTYLMTLSSEAILHQTVYFTEGPKLARSQRDSLISIKSPLKVLKCAL
jgi:hypothetical protein